MMLSGDRVPLENGVLARLLGAQEALISGRQPDRALNSAALGFLHKAADLTQDGRWLTYRQRTGVDTGIFRVGQSFWPDDQLKPTRPQNLVGRWNIDSKEGLPLVVVGTDQGGLTLFEAKVTHSLALRACISSNMTLSKQDHHLHSMRSWRTIAKTNRWSVADARYNSDSGVAHVLSRYTTLAGGRQETTEGGYESLQEATEADLLGRSIADRRGAA
jgi:hypothetical protein